MNARTHINGHHSTTAAPSSTPTRTGLKVKPSGPGVRWSLSPTRAVRFATDLTRVYDVTTKRNLLRLRYQGSSATRPADPVLATLLALFTDPAANPSSPRPFHRCWVAREQEGGWALELDLRGGPYPLRLNPSWWTTALHDVMSDPRRLRLFAAQARQLWALADEIEANPDRVPDDLRLELNELAASKYRR
jgi:hypothetical protein